MRAALWLGLLCACVAPSKTPKTVEALPKAPERTPVSLTIFVTSGLHGYLGPCGCSENMRGGIARTAHLVNEARAAGHPVLLIDTGDLLFATPTLTADARVGQERKAQALAAAFKAMQVSAVDVSATDLAAGQAFTDALNLPTLPPEGEKIFEVQGQRIAVIARDTVEALAEASGALEAKHVAFSIGLLRGPLSQALPAVSAPNLKLNLVIATRPEGAFGAEDSRVAGSSTKVVQVQSKGRSVLRVDATLGLPGFQWLRGPADAEKELSTLDERIGLLKANIDSPDLTAEVKALKQAKLTELMQRREALAHAPVTVPSDTASALLRVEALENTVPADPTVAAIVTQYDRDVGQLNLAWAREHGAECAPAEPGQPSFVGNERCASCHPDAVKVWQGTGHARAFATLENVGKQYHLECVGCHVTGWQQPTGVCRLDRVEAHRDVGCESCHGPGSKHVRAPHLGHIIRASGADMCTGCHTPENSIHFNFASYLPHILGPGHQRAEAGVKLAPAVKQK